MPAKIRKYDTKCVHFLSCRLGGLGSHPRPAGRLVAGELVVPLQQVLEVHRRQLLCVLQGSAIPKQRIVEARAVKKKTRHRTKNQVGPYVRPSVRHSCFDSGVAQQLSILRYEQQPDNGSVYTHYDNRRSQQSVPPPPQRRWQTSREKELLPCRTAGPRLEFV